MASFARFSTTVTPIADLTSADDTSGSVSKFKLFDHSAFDFSFDKHEGGHGSSNWWFVNHHQHGSDETSDSVCDGDEEPNEQNDPPQAPQGSEEHNNEDEPCADLSPSDDSEDQQNEGPFDDWCPPPVAELKERESDQTSEIICDGREDTNEQNDPPQAPQGDEEHNNEEAAWNVQAPVCDAEDQDEGSFDDWCPPPVAELKECVTEFRQDMRELFRDYCERPSEVDFRVELTQTLDHLHDCIDAWRDSWHQSTGT